MIKKAALSMVLLMVLFAGGAVVASMFSSEEPAPTPKTKQRKPTTQPWNGLGSRQYTTSFVKRGEEVTLRKVDFAGLNTAKTTATLQISVRQDAPGRPSWLRSKSFYVRSEDRTYKPKTRILADGDSYLVQLTFANLPTTGLGPSCEDRAWSSPKLGLTIKTDKQPFAVQLVAPDAPAGHCLADPKLEEARLAKLQKARDTEIIFSKATSKRTGKGKKRRRTITVTGTTTRSGLRKVVVQARQKGRYRTVASGKVKRGAFTARFKVKKAGRYKIRVGYKSGGTVFPAEGSGEVRAR